MIIDIFKPKQFSVIHCQYESIEEALDNLDPQDEIYLDNKLVTASELKLSRLSIQIQISTFRSGLVETIDCTSLQSAVNHLNNLGDVSTHITVNNISVPQYELLRWYTILGA